MKRGDAVQVLREIVRICGETSTIITSVSLRTPSQKNGLAGYQLDIGANLDDACRKGLMPLFKERGLEMQETKDHITIFKRR